MRRLFNSMLLGFALSCASLAAMVLFSPYRHNAYVSQKRVEQSVEINKPASVVFDYLGNSQHASEWSVYVNHITPMNSDEIPDGQVGSMRRCFVNKNETGTLWDEQIIAVVPNIRRTLSIYNLQGFPITAKHLATDQIYEALNDSVCRLTFTLYFSIDNPSRSDQLKMHFAAYRVRSIFEQNLNNIKRAVEQLPVESADLKQSQKNLVSNSRK